MKLLFVLLLFCSSLSAQSFHGQASIIRDSVTLQVKPYIDIEFNDICISFPNLELHYHGVWRDRYDNEYRLYISDNDYWLLNTEMKELSLHETGDYKTTYVLQ